MIVEEYKLGNTTIRIDDTYFPETEDQKEKIYESFNDTALEILKNVNGRKWQKMTKEQKMYCKVGQAVCKGTVLILFYSFWIGIGIGFLMK